MSLEINDLKEYEWLWHNDGLTAEGEQISLKDALATPNAPVFLPRVIENIVKEAAEPLLVGTNLLQRINFHYGQVITFPAVGGYCRRNGVPRA
jgi:hypothetical protein